MTEIPSPQPAPEAWRDHVEDRLRTWKQRTMNKSGDMLALDDFMDSESLEDLIDFVCDEWAEPAAQAPAVGADDTKRLDWLERQGSVALERRRASTRPDAMRYWCIEDQDGDEATEDTAPDDRQTLRAAIDAAMEAYPPVQGTGESQP